jgi:hypothetical protein
MARTHRAAVVQHHSEVVMRSISLALSGILLAASAGTFAGPAIAAPAPSAPVAPYHVSLQASAKVVTAKQDKVVLSGFVVPKPPAGSTVLVQAKYENKNIWRKVGTAVVKPNGKYRFIDRPQTSNDRVYRVVKKADSVALADKSRTRSVTVFAWVWLTQYVTSAGENTTTAASLPINGDTYTHVVYADRLTDAAFVEYTLGRNCTTFETTFGLSDRTETGGQATISMTADGVSAYARTFNLGESDAQSFDVSDVYRMRLDFAQVTTTPDTEPAAGGARVLCD